MPENKTLATPVFREISVDDIDPDPGQPRKRFDEAALLALGQNMKEIGQQIPVIVVEIEVPDQERSR